MSTRWGQGQQAQRAGQGRPNPAMSNLVNLGIPSQHQMDAPGQSQPQPAAPSDETSPGEGMTPPARTGHVLQLEQRIAEKDEVIGLLKDQLTTKDKQIDDLSTRFGNLSDRFADTQKLLGAMQRMFAPLLGQSDPYRVTAEPDVTPSTHAAPVDNQDVTQ